MVTRITIEVTPTQCRAIELSCVWSRMRFASMVCGWALDGARGAKYSQWRWALQLSKRVILLS